MSKRAYVPIAVARMFLFVREAGANKGLRVEAIQHWGGGIPGDSWCMWFATMVLDLCYQGESPIPRQGNCQAVWDLAQKNGWVVTDPQQNDLYFYVTDAGHAHHVGFVTGAQPLTGISGNTNDDGSDNGDRVAEKAITATHFVRVPSEAAA